MDAAAATRLGIPLLIGEDGIHGHSFHPGATIFPTQLALAASWDLDLLEQVARVTAREMATTGAHWTFSPVLCLTRDQRWGRTGETFGQEVAESRAFSVCQVEKVFKQVCFRPPQSQADSDAIENIATLFESGGYRMKSVFAEVAVHCMGQ